MVGRIAIMVAIGVGLLAAAAVFYLFSQGALPRFETANKTPAGTVAPAAPKASPPQTAALPEPGGALRCGGDRAKRGGCHRGPCRTGLAS
jgi:hypothetical protein